MEEPQTNDQQSLNGSDTDRDFLILDDIEEGKFHLKEDAKGERQPSVDANGGQSLMDVDLKETPSVEDEGKGKSYSDPRVQVPIDFDVASLEKFCSEASRAFFIENGLGSHQINSYNDFVSHGLQELFDSIGEVTVEPDYDPSKKAGARRHATIKFGRVEFEEPVLLSNNSDLDEQTLKLKPRHARLQKKTYSAAMKVEMTVQVYSLNKSDTAKTGEDPFIQRKDIMKETKWVSIGWLPVMVKSNLCWLHKLQESDCQFDSGGYFLIRGMEKGQQSTPPGGFMNLFKDNYHQQPSQNDHLVGATRPTISSSPPNVVTPTPNLDHDTIQVDSRDEVVRTDKRILWTQEEDVRLMSAWLKNSTDPINGADRRNEQYWGDVVKTYNMTTPKHRIRNQKQATDCWHKINKWTDLFHSAWLKARRIYTSGHSDQMWIDKAHKFYEEDNRQLNLGHFVLIDVWYAVRGEAKWISYNNELKKARKRKANSTEGSTSEKEDDDVHELPRPMGQKKAKKAAFDAKKDGKSKECAIDVEQLEKYSRVQAEAHANRLKVLEVQQKLSAEKLEASRLCHLAAVESKEAKILEKEGKILEKEAKMMEAYNCLLSRDTAGYSAEEKAEHVAALRCLRLRLFPEN